MWTLLSELANLNHDLKEKANLNHMKKDIVKSKQQIQNLESELTLITMINKNTYIISIWNLDASSPV